jgi:uncharacterized membrane protein YhaH (DUF805 family)
MWGWVVHCFRNWRRFDGRAGRPEYWWLYLFVLIGNWVCGFAGSFDRASGEVLTAAFTLVTIVPSFAVASRRLHDTGHG